MLFGRKNKNPIEIADKGVVEWKYATCGYCSTGCSIEVGLNAEGEPVASHGLAGADVNRQYSHVYLPAAVWAETEGCFFNTERRVPVSGRQGETAGAAVH